MAWYPGAKKMELQPESDAQPAIDPTQFIVHSVAAPWTKERIFEYWRDSTNLESHFGQSYDGSVAQYIGTQTRADACYLANRRSDGTGAVSIETASNLDHTDPWTDAQVEGLIRLGVWMHQQHGIPLRICRSWTDPGYGYHRLWPEWAQGGTDCPGNARVAQFKNVIFPAIVARANGQPQPPVEDDMPTPRDLWAYKGTDVPYDAYAYLLDSNRRIIALSTQVAALSATVGTLADKLGDDVDTAEVVAAVKAAIAAAVVKVDVTVDDLTPGA
ncbi:N-acetylmuramoyl-L-alanine amidase [Streptomyces goshikiensis]|uniref:peptidoglycan recognition protein family protein n=1 Tax=Streptomyces goshikiensis TaxID=1942 RepID=UPI00365BB7BF